MPVLYPTAALFFFLNYWFDKFLLIKCHRRPIKFDNYLAKTTLGWFKYILILHVIGFLMLYSSKTGLNDMLCDMALLQVRMHRGRIISRRVKLDAHIANLGRHRFRC